MATNNEGEVSRREFVSTSVKGAAALALGAQLVARTSSAEETGLQLRPLGRTGVATAWGFSPMPEADRQKLLASVKLGAGRFELYKTTQRMDGPYHARQHGVQVG